MRNFYTPLPKPKVLIMEKKKNTMPIILSVFVFPGAGQLYNKKYLKGFVIIFGAIAITIYLLVMVVLTVMGTISATDVLPADPVQMYSYIDALKAKIIEDITGYVIKFALIFIPLWIYGIVDAWLLYRRES